MTITAHSATEATGAERILLARAGGGSARLVTQGRRFERTTNWTRSDSARPQLSKSLASPRW